MANAAFDTLTVSKELQDAGIEAKHAEAIAWAVKQGQGDLATKQDLNLLKTELKSDIEQLRTELKSDNKHLKSDIDHLRTELKSDIEQLKTEMEANFDKLKSDINWIKWSMAIMIAIIGVFSIFGS